MAASVLLNFPAGHPVFAGHFPGQPIVPGVMLLDAAIHAIAQGDPVICQVSSAKFLSPAAPDEDLTLSWASAGPGQVRFDIAACGRQVATGMLRFGDTP